MHFILQGLKIFLRWLYAQRAISGYRMHMVPTRVRDCAAEQFFEVGLSQADASRRQSGPRKASISLSTVRFRSKSYLHLDSDNRVMKRKLVVAREAAGTSVGGCGVEDQVGRVGITNLQWRKSHE